MKPFQTIRRILHLDKSIKGEELIRLKTGKIVLSGRVHGSVGINYTVKYPQDAFDVEMTISYHHPDKMEQGMCGGDDAIRQYTLIPKKRGRFTVIEEESFRGTVEKTTIHNFLVK